MTKIGKRLEKCRQNLGMSQQEVADKLGITRATLGHWENDKREPSFDMLNKLSEIYNVTIGEFFGENPEATVLSEETKNSLFESSINMLSEKGLIDKNKKFEDQDEITKNIILSLIDQTIMKLNKNSQR